MKKYSFSFTTVISFDLPIINHNLILKCFPGEYPFQRISQNSFTMIPKCGYCFGKDSFGNTTISAVLNEEHKILEFSASGVALLGKYKVLEDLDRIFLFDTEKTKSSDKMIEFLDGIGLTDDMTASQKAVKISSAVYDYMEYKKGSTTTETTAAEAFEQKSGVCQDYTHITISLLRKSGIAARYCVGLIPGEGETHAWVEYYSDGAWYGVDPTNNMQIDYGYIKISHGRDSYDCGIERGCFVCSQGLVEQRTEVMVKVGEIE